MQCRPIKIMTIDTTMLVQGQSLLLGGVCQACQACQDDIHDRLEAHRTDTTVFSSLFCIVC
jgi:hypothetical protein